jgi:hypothetical protein
MLAKFKKGLLHDQRLKVGCVSFLTVAINFLTTIMILKAFGFGEVSDLYFLSSSILMLLGMVITWPLCSLIIPKCSGGPEHEQHVHGAFVSFFLVAMLLSPLLVFVIEKSIKLALNVDNISRLIPAFLAAAFALEMYSSFIVQIFRLKCNFILPALSSFFAALLTLCSIVLLSMTDINWEFLVAFAILAPKLFILIVVSLVANKYLSRPVVSYRYILSYLKGAGGILTVSIFTKSSDFFEKSIAAQLQTGFMSYFSFFQRFFTAASTVLISAISSPTLNFFSNKAMEGSVIGCQKVILENAVIYIIFSLMLTIFLLSFHSELLSLVGYDDEFGFPVKYVIVSLSLVLFSRCMSQTLHNFCLGFNGQNIVSAFDFVGFIVSISIKTILTMSYGVVGFLIAVCVESFLLVALRLAAIKVIVRAM